MWRDIAAIVFSCTTINHLGLIDAIESVIKRKLWIINCPRCFTFWSVFFYQVITDCNLLTSLAISLLCAYIAIWIELIEGIIDKLYQYVYEQIYSTESAVDTDEECA